MSVRPLGFKLDRAMQQMAADNINLARREAWRFQRRTDMNYDDLESVAFIGLMKACHKFDAERGWKFSTFAVPKIRGELLHYVRDYSYLLRLSHRMRENWVKGRRHLDKGATDQQVADELKISLEEWLDTRSACSGAPLELKENAAVFDKQLQPVEDDRLARLEDAVVKAWSRVGESFAKNLAANYRFNHLLRDHAASTWVALSEAIYEGRDQCFIDMGVPDGSTKISPLQHLTAVSVEQTETGTLVIHHFDMGNGRTQLSLLDG